MCLILFIIIKSEGKTQKLKEEYKQMLNYVTKYEKIITEQGKNNHEFKNQLMVIKGYALMNNNKKLVEYIDSVINDSKKMQNSYLISQLNKFPDGGIKGLLYYKLSTIEEEKIKYEITVDNGVKSKFKGINTNMYKDITKILGVIIDNSIDAAKKSKKREILIIVNKLKNGVIFNISNSYEGIINIEKIGTGYTTKGKGHGYGLKLVNDILSNNQNLKLENEVNQNFFINKFTISNEKK